VEFSGSDNSPEKPIIYTECLCKKYKRGAPRKAAGKGCHPSIKTNLFPRRVKDMGLLMCGERQ